jgi:hypothetical protein
MVSLDSMKAWLKILLWLKENIPHASNSDIFFGVAAVFQRGEKMQ